MAAKIYDEDRVYYQRSIEPLLRESKSFVEFIGEGGGNDKDELLGNAYAFLFPIDWPEPFGLVMIESLACGTPVSAWNNGSVPEILSDGVTGFVVDTIDEAVKAVSKVANLDRYNCRRAFDRRFDRDRVPDSRSSGCKTSSRHPQASSAWTRRFVPSLIRAPGVQRRSYRQSLLFPAELVSYIRLPSQSRRFRPRSFRLLLCGHAGARL